jgi:hypothetical protein
MTLTQLNFPFPSLKRFRPVQTALPYTSFKKLQPHREIFLFNNHVASNGIRSLSKIDCLTNKILELYCEQHSFRGVVASFHRQVQERYFGKWKV